MKSNRQARHILGLDHKISNQRKIVTEGDKSSVVNNPTGRKVIHNHQSSMTIKHHCLRNGVFVFICFILGADALAVMQRR